MMTRVSKRRWNVHDETINLGDIFEAESLHDDQGNRVLVCFKGEEQTFGKVFIEHVSDPVA